MPSYICGEASHDMEAETLIVSNGTRYQTQLNLNHIIQINNNDTSILATRLRIYTYKEWISLLRKMKLEAKIVDTSVSKNEVVFMFFDEIESIGELLCDLKSLYSSVATDTNGGQSELQYEALLYFEASLASCRDPQPSRTGESHSFLLMLAMAHDIIEGLAPVLHRIKGVYLDDRDLLGSREIPLVKFVRNFPTIENIVLRSGQADMNLSPYL